MRKNSLGFPELGSNFKGAFLSYHNKKPHSDCSD
jgi:hypothetical protein